MLPCTRAVKKGLLFNEGPFVKELNNALQGFGVHHNGTLEVLSLATMYMQHLSKTNYNSVMCTTIIMLYIYIRF